MAIEYRIWASNIRIYSNSATCRIFEFEYVRILGDSRIFDYSNIRIFEFFEYLFEYEYSVRTIIATDTRLVPWIFPLMQELGQNRRYYLLLANLSNASNISDRY